MLDSMVRDLKWKEDMMSSVVWSIFFFFKQKPAYEMRISDWSSDVCSSDLYCNDGDWVEHCTALTEDDNGYLELMHWTEQRTCLANAHGDRVQPATIAALAFAALPAVGSLPHHPDRLLV